MDALQESRQRFLLDIRHALELLVFDAELIASGFRYFYVVDFAAIYAYMYQQSNLPFAGIPGESEERSFARQQTALQALFGGYLSPLLLIPPYVSELNSHLRSLAVNVELAAVDVGSSLYKEKLARLISRSEHFRAFIQLRATSQTADNDHRLRVAAVALGKECFPELYTALAVTSMGPHDRLNLLFENDIIQDSQRILPKCVDIDYYGPITYQWYKSISAKRKAETAQQSLTDAMACTYVEAANNLLNQEQKIVVFISPSTTVDRALAERSLVMTISHAGHRVSQSVTRNLTYSFLAAVFKNDRTAMHESLATVRRLLELYESPIPLEWKVEARREAAARDWNRCENLLLMADSSLTQTPKRKGANQLDSSFLEVLYQLHEATNQNKDSIAAEIESRLSQLHRETIELNKLIPTASTLDIFRSVNLRRHPEGRMLILQCLQDELPMAIAFTDRDVIHVAQSFSKLKADNYSEDSVLAVRSHIFSAASHEGASPDHHLLAGYILALEGQYEAALAELDGGRLKANDIQRRELMLLSGSIERKLYHATEACELLEQVLAVSHEDCRANLEYAKSLWLKWRDTRGGLETELGYLDKALNHLAIASRRPNTELNKMLSAQIENVAAYIHTERALSGSADTAECLKQAHKHIGRLQNEQSEREWISSFFDTRGYVYYATAKNLPAGRGQEKKALLEAAARDVSRALECELTDGDFEVRREHQRLISAALNTL